MSDNDQVFEAARAKHYNQGKQAGRNFERARCIDTLRRIAEAHDSEAAALTALRELEQEHDQALAQSTSDSPQTDAAKALAAQMRGGRDLGDLVADRLDAMRGKPVGSPMAELRERDREAYQAKVADLVMEKLGRKPVSK